METNQKKERPHTPQAPKAQPQETKPAQKIRTTFKGGFFVL